MNGVLFEKLKVLSDGAKYDVSCSSSGVARSGSAGNGKIGSAAAAGICHSWAADGRCISLLKVLYSNDCSYNCEYCVNRRTADVTRATFEPKELADLAMEFYRRNYIEGLFLSSAVLGNADNTTERIFHCLYLLREDYGFRGYIHAKVLPGVSPELLHRIGLVADRLSVNIELPSEDSLKKLAPQKRSAGIFKPMKQILNTQAQQKTLKHAGLMGKLKPLGANISVGDGSLDDMTQNPIAVIDERKLYKEKFAPAGQTTQMIIGASPETDRSIIKTSETLYRSFRMKRVYFSAYIPIVESDNLPSLYTAPPLKREHRLYQADWLLRFYGFSADEILGEDSPFLDVDLDPKIVWALRNIEQFPIEVNKASLEEILRIPGIGNKSALRIVRQRKIAAVKYDDLKKIGVVLKRARFFLTCSGRYYGDKILEPEYVRNKVLSADSIKTTLIEQDRSPQISMFDAYKDVLDSGKHTINTRDNTLGTSNNVINTQTGQKVATIGGRT